MVNQTQVSEIIQLINKNKYLIDAFKADIEDKEVVMTLGNTRSGKSTFVNYVQKNKLVAFKSERNMYIKKQTLLESGPEIRQGSLSCTEYPTVWNIGQQNILIVDAPGFEDNRGVAQNILNTIFFNQLQCAKTVKFLLIVDVNDIITDNVQSFIRLLNQVQMLFDNRNELYTAISLIFTKDYKNFTIDEIVELLRRKFIIPPLKINKNLIYEIIKNKNRIGIFPYPSQDGEIPSEFDCNIEGAISNSFPVINTAQIKFYPSESARKVLLEIYHSMLITMNLRTELEKSVKRFEKYFDIDKYIFASTEDELDNTKISLLYILTKITTEKAKSLVTLNELFISLGSVSSQISEQCEKNLNFMKFLDNYSLLDDIIKQTIKEKYKQSLDILEIKINKLIEKINAEMEARTTETLQYILSQVNTDRAKIVVTGAAFVPLVKKACTALGIPIPSGLEINVMQISASGCGFFASAAIGLAAGSYAAHYYNTVVKRCSYRREQGR